MLDDTLRRELDEQVTAGLTAALGSTLQERLSRRLLESEWRLVGEIVRNFVAETLVAQPNGRPSPPRSTRGDSMRRELRELLAFQRSPSGRKAARLTPLIAAETAEAINDRSGEARPCRGSSSELQGAFPILKNPQSP